MKKIWLFLLLFLWLFSPVFAEYWLNFEQFLTTYVDVVVKDSKIPDSYNYIELKYPNVVKWTKLYKTLQKAVYLDLFPNAKLEIPFDKKINQNQAIKIISTSFDIEVFGNKKELVTVDRFLQILFQIQEIKNQNIIQNIKNNEITNDPLFLDVYKRLQDTYLSESWINLNSLLHSSIRWLVDWLNDPYTSFFPPTEATSFNEEMQWEYFGIGAYVEMNKPWEFIIVSPIKWSPAEKNWLIWWDRVVQINNTIVDKNMSINTAVSLTKWQAWTIVKLKILRDWKLLDFVVTRQKIVIENIDSKIYRKQNSNICLITISMFDFGVARDFYKIMTDLSNKNCDKYIFDVRNNPGWSLEEVVSILNYFVPNDQTSVIIKSRFITEEIIAWESEITKIKNVPVRVLINEWSASASEIFAGVIKDYIKDSLLVWQKTFGKWSVQELINYQDWSMLKYTIAKRYTGKSKINVDHNWIIPDKIISNKKESLEDDILEWAIKN